MFNWQKKIKIPGGVIFRVFILFIISYGDCLPQTKSNMEIFYTLVDSSVEKAIKELPPNAKEISLEANLGQSYSVFNNRIIANFEQKSIKTNGNAPHINFVIDDANVIYSEMLRDGLYGEYMVSRKVMLKGNYLISDNNVKQFAFSSMDTINVDEISNYESFSYPFTQGEIPSEPFFSGLFEPIIAISAAAAVVILFFTIRSQ